MRISGIRVQRGSVIVLMMAAVPLMVAMLAVVIDMGRIYVARARLDVATDRAAYVAAAVYAHALNEIAKANWRINKAWRDLSRDFKADSQQSADAARERYAKYEEERDRSFEKIRTVEENVKLRAESAARGVFLLNAPHGSPNVSIYDDTFISDDEDPEAQNDNPRYSNITGGSFIDPVSYEGGSFPALKYLIKRRSPGPRIGVFGEQEIKPMLLGHIIQQPIKIKSSAAASSFGGSMETFARKATDTIGDAEAQIDDDGVDYLYHTAIVPMWTLGDEGEDARH